ncbi:tetratricopeptide repeat protein [Salinisphaera orenii]|uniref:tetratricopeptide repeat protein n=1 Tax=Salinisphaera orenii TaxID=856731 RepID=UPI000DBE96F7
MSRWVQGRFLVLMPAALLLTACAGGQNRVDDKNAARANTQLAGNYLQRGDLDNAKKYFQKALKYDSNRVRALWGLAVVNSRNGHTQRAGDYYRRAMSVKRQPELANSYAVFLCQNGRSDKAMSLFRQVANNPDYGHQDVPLANAGLCLLKGGQTGNAKQLFKQALVKSKYNVVALTQSAKLALRQGDNSRAAAHMKRVARHNKLSQSQLKLAARIQLANGVRRKALEYISRYNDNTDESPLTVGKLQSQGL